jgi:hypothetical protein
MPFEWSKVGAPPAQDELEISVMGPGFGESVVCHFGANEWFIVDSCIEPGQARPAPLSYLEALGVDPATAVKIVLATHWDQDHVRGLGDVVQACKIADFCCAKAFVNEEFQFYMDEMSIGTRNRGVKDIQHAFDAVWDSGRTCRQAVPGKVLLRRPTITGGCVELLALSPSDKEFDLFLQEIASQRPGALQPLRQAVARSPNLASVVSLLVLDDCAVLLGADMERRPEADRGWNSVVREGKNLFLKRAGVVKVPHHGSENAHDDGMWNELLEPAPVGVIAPFGKGPVTGRPPTVSDIARIRAKTCKLYVTAPHATAKPPARSPAVTRGLRDSNIKTRSLARSLGLVRLRKPRSAGWAAEIFGAAYIA